MMTTLLFWIFAALMLGFGAAVVFLRNPVSSALSLVMSFLSLSGLYFLLNAYFIGIIQVLVYAGAVMVLFLFIIMLLDLKSEKRRRLNLPALLGGSLVTAIFMGSVIGVIGRFPEGNQPMPDIGTPPDDVAGVGTFLFTDYNLPLQVIGVLLLVATIGVVVLSKRQLR